MQLLAVPSRTGLQWVRLGLVWTLRQPWAAFATVGAYVLVVAALSALPVVGGVLPLAVAQIASVGLMMAARRISRGERLRPRVLLAGLLAGRAQVRDLLTLAGIYVAAVMALLLLSSAADGGTLLRMLVFGRSPAGDALADPALQRAAMLAMAGYLPVSMAFWFAPVLVSCWCMGPAQALFTSFVVVGRNLGAFLVFELQWMALMVGLPLLLASAAAALGGDDRTVSVAALAVALPLFVAFTLSAYASVESLLSDPKR